MCLKQGIDPFPLSANQPTDLGQQAFENGSVLTVWGSDLGLVEASVAAAPPHTLTGRCVVHR